MSALALLRTAFVTAALTVVCAVFACTPSLEDGTVCGQAAERLGTCGVLLPFTTDPGSCTGDQEAVARCITSVGSSCDALAGLSTHLNDCLDADGGSSFPTSVTGIGLGDLDGAAFTLDGAAGDDDDGGGATAFDSAAPPGDAGTNADAAAPSDSGGGAGDNDAAVDAGGDAGDVLLDVLGSVADGETKSYQTDRLGPGTYLFTLSGESGAQLRVRKVQDSTTEDCVVDATAAGATCLDTITRSAVLYADVVGDGASATFHLVAVTETP